MALISHHFGESGIIENDNILLPATQFVRVPMNVSDTLYTTDTTPRVIKLRKLLKSNSLPYYPQILHKLSLSFDF